MQISEKKEICGIDFTWYSVEGFPKCRYLGKPKNPNKSDVHWLAREIRFSYPDIDEETAVRTAAKEYGVEVEIYHGKKGVVVYDNEDFYE